VVLLGRNVLQNLMPIWWTCLICARLVGLIPRILVWHGSLYFFQLWSDAALHLPKSLSLPGTYAGQTWTNKSSALREDLGCISLQAARRDKLTKWQHELNLALYCIDGQTGARSDTGFRNHTIMITTILLIERLLNEQWKNLHFNRFPK
jgi:hypothetical protein